MLYGQLKSGTDYGGSVKSPALELFTKAPVRNNSCILPSLLEQQVSFPVTPSMGDLANKDRHLQTKQTPPETGTRGREIKRMRGVALPEQGTSLLKARLDSACSRLGRGRWPWTVLSGSPSLPQQAPAQLLTLGFYPTKHRTSSTCRQVAGFSKHSQHPPEVFVLCHPCQGCEEALPQSRLSPLLSLHSIPVLLQNQTRASFTDRAPGTPSSASSPGEL